MGTYWSAEKRAKSRRKERSTRVLFIYIYIFSTIYPCPRILVNKIFIRLWQFCFYLVFELGLKYAACSHIDIMFSVKSSHLSPCKPDQPIVTLSLDWWGHYEGRDTVTVMVYTRCGPKNTFYLLLCLFLEKRCLKHPVSKRLHESGRLRCKSPWLDTDLVPQDLLLRFQYSNTHTQGLQTSCGGKGPVGEKGQHGHSLKRRALLSTSATPSRGEHLEPWGDQPL